MRKIKTQNRVIKTKIPAPGTNKIIKSLEKNESRSMQGQLPIVWSKAEGHSLYDIAGNKFIDFTCKCDLDKNYIETGDLGVGPKGCIKISDKHAHQIPDIDVNVLSAPQISDYLELIESKPSVVSTLAHTRGLAGTDLNGHLHSSLLTPHIHK